MLEVNTLGGIDVRITVSDGTADRSPVALQARPLAVFLYLATAGRPRFQRSHLIGVFWPDRESGRARNTLSKTLGRIREGVGRGVLVARPQDVGIAADAVRTDLASFEAAVAGNDAAAALALYRGDFLADLVLRDAPPFEQWLEGMRVRLRRSAAAVARRHARGLAARGEAEAAVAVLEAATAWQPADEALSRDLIATIAQAGDVARALMEYDRLERVLATEIGTAPAAETRALAERVRHRGPLAGRAGTTGDGAGDGFPANGEWPRSIAVLPFTNLSGDPEQDFFADGMTDALITELARQSPCRVISRQSVLRFRGSHQPLAEIASALGVDAVIEGSVIREGDRVRITAQLIRAEPEMHIWADTFDHAASDVLALHENIARGIAVAIRDRPGRGSGPGSPRRHRRGNGWASAEGSHAGTARVDPVAYEAYLKGRHFSLRPPHMDRAISHYRAAVERDPLYAPAWTGLAAAWANLAVFAYVSPADAFPELRRAFERALAIDPDLGDAIAQRGMYRMLADRDWYGARRDFLEAVERSPHSADARVGLAVFLGAMGESDAALEQMAAAALLDPLGPVTRFARAWCFYHARQYRESILELDVILELYPDFALVWPYAAAAHALLGQSEPARDAARQGIDRLPLDHAALGLGAAVLAFTGEQDEAWSVLDRLLALEADHYLDPWAAGVAYAGLRDYDRAAHWFRRMYDERSPSAFCVRHDPLLDPVRDHPVFRDVVRRLAFPPVT